MNTLEIINRAFEFYADSNNHPGFDKAKSNCRYFIQENSRCAVGCLWDSNDAETFQLLVDRINTVEQYLTVAENEDYIVKATISSIATLVFNTKHPRYDSEDFVAVRKLIAKVLPEDLNYIKGMDVLRLLQTSHDFYAAGKPEDFFSSFVKYIQDFATMYGVDLPKNENC